MNGDSDALAQWPNFGEILAKSGNAAMLLFDALMLVRIRRGEVLLDPGERSAIDSDRQRLFLQELGRIYPKLLDRSARLASLTFRDEQLAEASRCYLYGFWRATVVLSATALDSTHRGR